MELHKLSSDVIDILQAFRVVLFVFFRSDEMRYTCTFHGRRIDSSKDL